MADWHYCSRCMNQFPDPPAYHRCHGGPFFWVIYRLCALGRVACHLIQHPAVFPSFWMEPGGWRCPCGRHGSTHNFGGWDKTGCWRRELKGFWRRGGISPERHHGGAQ